MFEVKETTIRLPEQARIFESMSASAARDDGANWIRISQGKKVCVDCYSKYDRFNV